MAKRVRVSADDVTYTTLPGNTAELRNEAGELDDTIFGQDFASGETGLINWQLNANSLYKGFAGYICSIKKTGIATTMTGEAMSLVSGKIYQITAGAKQILDPETSVVVKDNAVNHTADVIRIDYLNGIVEFDAGYTVTGPVTMDAKYLPATEVGGTKSWSLTMSAEAVDESDIPTARANGGFGVFARGLKTVSLELQGTHKASNAFIAALTSRSILVVEINPDNNMRSVARGFFKYSSQNQGGDVGALEEETINLRLFVPDIEKMELPFKWTHSALTTLNVGVRNLLAAWETGAQIYVQYLPDGTNGWKGTAVVTDMSLSGGLEAMNEFTVNLQGSGAMTAHP